MRVPNLCIHLQSATERASFTINKETHLARALPALTHPAPRRGPVLAAYALA